MLLTYSSAIAQEIWIHQKKDEKVKIDKYEASTVDSITFHPCDSIIKNCCSYILYVSNNESANLFKKIKLTPIGTTKINNASSDEDVWMQTNASDLSYIEFTDFSGGSLPIISTEEENIWFSIDPGSSNVPKVRVEWIDNSGEVIASQILNLPCYSEKSIDDDSIDWDSFTEITKGGQYNVFSSIDQEACSNSSFKTSGTNDDCSIIKTLLSANSSGQTELWISFNKQLITNLDEVYINSVKVDYSGSDNIVIQNASLDEYTIEVITYIFVEIDGKLVKVKDCQDEKKVQIFHPNPCLFTYLQVGTPCPDFNLLFTYLELNAIGQNLTFNWKFTKDGNTVYTGTGNPRSVSLSSLGLYKVTLEITTSHGAKYSCTQDVKLSDECLPNLNWRYNWCDDDKIDREKEYKIDVTFTNQSSGGVCPSFQIDFGNGFVPFTGSTMNYSFKGKPGTSFPVKFRMSNNNPNAVVCSNVNYSVVIEPLRVNFTGQTCPNGDIILNTDAPNPTWEVPGANHVRREVLGIDIENLPINPSLTYENDDEIVANYAPGTHTVFLTGYSSSTHAFCKVAKTFEVVDICCDERTSIKPFTTTINGKNYKMRGKFVVNYKFGFDRTKVISKTLAFKEKKKKNGNTRWKRFRPQQIRAAVYGDFYNDGDLGCRCDNKNHYEGSDTSWDWWIRGVRFRDKITPGVNYLRWDSASSIHEITVDGEVWIERIYLGRDGCSQ